MMDFLLDEDMLKNDVEYFFSLHGPRFDIMNQLMADSLNKRFGKEFRPIRILNAWPSSHYRTSNFIVLNKKGYSLSKELSKPVVFLPDYEDVNIEFAGNVFIRSLTAKLRKKQKTVFVYPFTTAFLDLPASDFTILGPNAELARYLDNKINQVKLFKKLDLPCNDVRVYETKEDLLAYAPEVVPCYISAAYTSGGNESGLIYSQENLNEFLAKLRLINKNNSFIVSNIFEDIVLAPNINALVTSDGKVFSLVLSDQILQGNRYLGNTYPSQASTHHVKIMDTITKKIGNYLATQGYRGLFGCDFLINKSGDLVVVDLNPRHQGGYACNGMSLLHKNISLTSLELSVLQDEAVNISQPELDSNLGFAWAHSKLIPSEQGQVIQKEHHHQTIEHPFKSIGEDFITEFYQKDSVFIEGYIGYQVHSAANRADLEARLLHFKERFESDVLGL